MRSMVLTPSQPTLVPACDIDCFIRARTPMEALSTVLEAVDLLTTMLTIRTLQLSVNALTIFAHVPETGLPVVMQFILKHFCSYGSALRRFDLTCCTLACTGKDIVESTVNTTQLLLQGVSELHTVASSSACQHAWRHPVSCSKWQQHRCKTQKLRPPCHLVALHRGTQQTCRT